MSHDGGRVHLTRRRLLLGGVGAIAISSGSAIGGTLAAFTDSEESTGNTITSGTVDLGFGSPATLDLTKDVSPEDSVSGTIELVNAGTVTGSLDVDVSYADSGGTASAADVARNLEVTTLTYDGVSLLGQLSDHNANGIVDLQDFSNNDRSAGETTANDLIDLADPGGGKPFAIELRLQQGTNNLKDNSIDVQFTFTLNQTDGQ